MPLAVKSLDHIVLTVKDLDATVTFYTTILGMRHEAFRSPKDPSVERSVPSTILCFLSCRLVAFKSLLAGRPHVPVFHLHLILVLESCRINPSDQPKHAQIL